MRQLYIILISAFLFSGCAVVNEYEDSFKLKYLHSTAVTDFDDLTKELLMQLCKDIKKVNSPRVGKPLYVVDYVNIKDLENHSELGFMLSEELKTQVTQMCNMSVYSIEYAKFLKIGSKGTKLLSRDINELHSKKVNRATYALVGTYAFTQRQLILYLKLIDLKTGIILKSATKATTITDEINNLELKRKEYRDRNFNPDSIYQPVVL